MQAFTDFTTLHRNSTGSHLHNHRINCHNGCRASPRELTFAAFRHVSAMLEFSACFPHDFNMSSIPPSSADAAAAELLRLYVQKGHNHKACHRFLKKSADDGDLCALQLPLFNHRFTGRGQQGIHSSAANEDSCGHSVKQIGTPICVPALIASCDTNFPLVCFHGPCMILPPKPFLAAALSCS